MARRQCDDCKANMGAYEPRTRVGDRMLCDACKDSPRGGLVSATPKTAGHTEHDESYLVPTTYEGDGSEQTHASCDCGWSGPGRDSDAEAEADRQRHLADPVGTRNPRRAPNKRPVESMKVVAHDSGDGMTVFHCPFCGSGQVLARSDRTIECQFCHTAFTVQVQPVYPNFPQTIDGQPMQVPGMPGQAGPPPGGPPPGSPMAGMDTDPNEPMDPAALGEGGEVPPTGEADEEADDESGSGDSSGHEKSKGNPFAKKTFKTHTGALLSGDEYANYLAIRTSSDPARTAALVKAARGQ